MVPFFSVLIVLLYYVKKVQTVSIHTQKSHIKGRFDQGKFD